MILNCTICLVVLLNYRMSFSSTAVGHCDALRTSVPRRCPQGCWQKPERQMQVLVASAEVLVSGVVPCRHRRRISQQEPGDRTPGVFAALK